MNKYRLKPEAVPFFNEKYATALHPFDVWESIGVDSKALEKIEEAYIEYGHYSNKVTGSKSLSGWSQDEGQHFYFTINFPSVKFREHDEFSDGKMTRDLMNRIQSQLNTFYEQFNVKSEEATK